jgi:aerobic C4-dicarboxylate transport protein
MSTSTPTRGGLFGKLYTQVVIAILVGIAVGYFFPDFGVALRPLGDGFIRLIRMLLAPIICGTIVVGIAKMDNLKEVGRIGLKALVYFEVVSTLALGIGLVVVNLIRPGAGMNVNPAELDASSIASYTATAATQEKEGVADFFLKLIPTSVVDAFARSDMLQIILFSVLLGIAMARFRAQTEPLLKVVDSLLHALFAVVGMIMRLAPLAALGAMAFTVGKYGFGVLGSRGPVVFAV